MTYPSINSSSIVAVINTSNGISYNQPRFDPLTVWNSNGIILANDSIVGRNAFSIFIDRNDIIYIVGKTNEFICIRMNNSLNLITTISTNSSTQFAIFVSSNNEIYTSPVNIANTVNKWTLDSPYNHTTVAYVDGTSFGLFVDINNTLYLSLRDKYKVVSKSLRSSSNILTVVAGTGCAGNTADTLNYPRGIFVDTNFDLYVADFRNHRVQLFRFGQRNGITVAGSGSLNVTITLKNPIQIVLDFDKNLFIVDSGNDRIVASGPNGFRCILGCSDSTNDQVSFLSSMAFDSFGNIYVTDIGKFTLQKFVRLNNSMSMPSYNQPRFCLNSTWNPNATTLADYNTIGSNPFGLYIDIDNSIYAINRDKRQILIWSNNSIVPNIVLYPDLSLKLIFVTLNGDVYVDDSTSVKQIVRVGSVYTNKSISVASISSSCAGLFVDISNSLYCTIRAQHQILKKWLNDKTSSMTAVAGNGSIGSTSNLLYNPNGIFVDTNFDLYVADCWNHRVQLFRLGQSNGITVVGTNSLNTTIALYSPVNIILDRNKYIFITDRDNNRIIGSDENGFRCIVGCSNSFGSSSNQLDTPQTLAFDSFGNLFVVDYNNTRIQKFTLSSKLCNCKIIKTTTK